MAKNVERPLDLGGVGVDLQRLVDRLELLVDTARRFRVTGSEPFDGRLDEPPVEVQLSLRDDGRRLDDVVIRRLDAPEQPGQSQDDDGYTELLRLTPLVNGTPDRDGQPDARDEPARGSLDAVLREFADALGADQSAEPGR